MVTTNTFFTGGRSPPPVSPRPTAQGTPSPVNPLAYGTEGLRECLRRTRRDLRTFLYFFLVAMRRERRPPSYTIASFFATSSAGAGAAAAGAAAASAGAAAASASFACSHFTKSGSIYNSANFSFSRSSCNFEAWFCNSFIFIQSSFDDNPPLF